MCEQHHGRVAVVLVGGDLVGIGPWVGGAGVAAAAAAAQYPDNGPEYGSVQASTGAFAHEAIESGVGHAVQGGQQQRQVVVVKYSWKIRIQVTLRQKMLHPESLDYKKESVPAINVQSRSSRVRTNRKTW